MEQIEPQVHSEYSSDADNTRVSPVGPLHLLNGGRELWIKQVPQAIYSVTCGGIPYTSIAFPRTTYVVTEPLDEVVKRFGWKTDAPADETA